MDLKSFQKNIKEICDENNLILSDELEEDSYVASIADSDETKNNVLNIYSDGSKIETYVTTSDGEEVEKFAKEGEFNDDEGLEFAMDSIDSFKVLSGIDPDNIETDDNGNPILNEDEEHRDIISGLDRVKMTIKSAADSLLDLSKLSDNPEIISIIVDLANNAYALVLDIESAVDSYYEIQEQDIEDSKEEREEAQNDVDEAKDRIKIAKAQLSMKNLANKNVISMESYHEFESLMTKIFG